MMEILIKMDDLGVPLFLETPKYVPLYMPLHVRHSSDRSLIIKGVAFGASASRCFFIISRCFRFQPSVFYLKKDVKRKTWLKILILQVQSGYFFCCLCSNIYFRMRCFLKIPNSKHPQKVPPKLLKKTRGFPGRKRGTLSRARTVSDGFFLPNALGRR